MTSSILPRRFVYHEGKMCDLPSFICLGKRTSEDGPIVTLHDHERTVPMYICGITGSGKSRFLESMMVQDIALGHPLCVLDPTGHLYRQALDFIARCTEYSQTEHGLTPEQVERTLDQYLFLDLDMEQNPLRLNPLDPACQESTEEMVDDLLKVTERLFGSVDQTRRIRQTLRNTLWVIVELNRLPDSERPEIPSRYEWPLNLKFASEFLSLSNGERIALVESLPDEEENYYVQLFWTRFFAQYTESQAQERIESTWNILQYFLGDSLVNHFFGVARSSFHIPDLLREGRSLFCHLPLGRN